MRIMEQVIFGRNIRGLYLVKHHSNLCNAQEMSRPEQHVDIPGGFSG